MQCYLSIDCAKESKREEFREMHTSVLIYILPAANVS